MSCNLEPCTVYTDQNLFVDYEMSDPTKWETNGASKETSVGYLSEAGILISDRTKSFHGIGQTIDGSLFTAASYSGKVMIKLEENNGPMTMSMTAQKTLISDGSKTYDTVGSVTIPDNSRWNELNFYMDTWENMDLYTVKFYTQSADLFSYFADYIYVTDSANLIDFSDESYVQKSYLQSKQIFEKSRMLLVYKLISKTPFLPVFMPANQK